MKLGLSTVFTMVFGTLVSAVLGCGGPSRRSDKVGSIFKNSDDLKSKVSNICQLLLARNEEPSLVGFELSGELCANVGRSAVDLNRLSGKKLGFAQVKTSSSQGLLKIQTRSEMWVNLSFLGVIDRVLPKLKENSDKAPSENEEFSLEKVGESSFDKESFEFAVDLRLNSDRFKNGFINIKNDFKVRGKLFKDERAIFATVRSPQKVPLKFSLLNNVKVGLLIVPHAEDVYVDIITEIDLYSYGPGPDEIMKEKFIRIIEDALAKLPEFFNEPGADGGL